MILVHPVHDWAIIHRDHYHEFLKILSLGSGCRCDNDVKQFILYYKLFIEGKKIQIW